MRAWDQLAGAWWLGALVPPETAGTAWLGRLGFTEVKRGQRPSKMPPKYLGVSGLSKGKDGGLCPSYPPLWLSDIRLAETQFLIWEE